MYFLYWIDRHTVIYRIFSTLLVLLVVLLTVWLMNSSIDEKREVPLAEALATYTSTLESGTVNSRAMGAAILFGLENHDAKRLATGELPPDAPSVLSALNSLRKLYFSDTAFLINRQGTVAAYSSGENTHGTGIDVSGSPYFQVAMQGTPSVYPAVSSVVNERGIFLAAPVRIGSDYSSKPVGAAVIKVSAGKLEALLNNWKDPAMLVSPLGVVFASNRKDWLFNLAGEISDRQLADIRHTRQFGQMFDRRPSSLPFTLTSPEARIDGVRYVVRSHPLEWDDPAGDWMLVMLDKRDPWWTRRNVLGLAATFGLIAAMSLFWLFTLARNTVLQQKIHRELRIAATTFDSQEGIVVTDANRVILRANRSFFNITGYSADEVIGNNTSMFRSGRHNPDFYAAMWERIDSVGSWEGDVWDRRKNGEIYPAHLIITAIRDKDGALANYVATYSDITERMQVEDKLRKSEELLRESQIIAGLGSYVLDIPAGYWKSSEMLDQLFGIDAAYERSVVGWEALVHPQDRAMMADYFRNEVIGKGHPFDKEYRIIRPSDKAERWVHGIGKLEFDTSGRLLNMRGTIQDITDRKRIELALQDSEARYRSFAEELQLGIIITQDGHIKYVNRAAIGMFGYPEDEIMEKPFLPFVDGPDRAWLMDLHRRRMQGEKVESPYVIGVLRGDGTVHQWQLHSSTIEWEGKLAALASIDDITERRRYEQQLRIAATTFESQEGIVITDADNVILRVNRSFVNITGYSAEEVIGRNTTMLNSGRHEPGFYAAMWERLNSNGSWEGDVWNRRKNGEVFPAHLIITAVKGKDGALTNYVATYSDITARVRAEEKLLDSLRRLEEKEHAKTRFLAAAGHDLRQPIAAATLFLEALKFTSQTQQQSELTERIDQSMRIFSSLLDRLLDISKFDAGLVKPQISTFNLTELFSWLEQNFDRPAHSKQLRLCLYFPSNRPLVVSTDIALVHSVLMNLVSNAIKFTRHGGILVSARLRGNKVLMQVWDTGIGIAEADIPNIFDEFYQVANPQRNREAGLGLGLSICQRAMSLLGGEISCRSRSGHGSVFEFSLPLNDELVEAKSPPVNDASHEPASQMFVHGKRVVVVEDDALVAASLVRLLYDLGADVWHFQNAEDALQNVTDISAADYFMVDYALGSGLNGIQFLEAVQQKQPLPIRAVIITGETSSQFISSISDCPWPVLHKPVNYARLASALNRNN